MSEPAAVVVAFRDPSALERCLRTLPGHEPVVVVNVTDDPDVAAVIRREGCVEVSCAKNVGYAAAVNLGVAALPPAVEWLAFMNDDVCVRGTPTTSTRGVGVPRHVSGASTQAAVKSLPTPVHFVSEWVLGRSRHQPEVGETLPAGTYSNAAAIWVDRATITEHPVPEEYFMYWEETAWFWRLQDAGVPAAVIDATVERPRGDDEFSRLKSHQMGANLIRLARERYGRPGVVLYAVLGAMWIARLIITDTRQPDRRRRWSARHEMGVGLRASTAAGGRPS